MSWLGKLVRGEPHFEIGGHERPYIRRWWLIPRNRVFNVYLHQILRSDDDRALHCHPWHNVSIVLSGCYREHLRDGLSRLRSAGCLIARDAETAHRLEIIDRPAWTLFLTGPRIRDWFFHCPQGLVHWRDFTNPLDTGTVGRGCD